MSSALSSSSPALASNNNYAILITTHEDGGEWQIAVTLVERFIIYVTMLLLFFMILALIVKLLDDCDGWGAAETASAIERNRLLAKESVPFTYGACEEEDVESGKCSSSSNSSEDLYDGKICVICYDEQRNCFFIPCGHSATCYHCAQRIKEEETKTCPVCRRYIGKVRKLFF